MVQTDPTESDPIQSDPIERNVIWQQSRKVLLTIHSVEFCDNQFVLSECRSSSHLPSLLSPIAVDAIYFQYSSQRHSLCDLARPCFYIMLIPVYAAQCLASISQGVRRKVTMLNCSATEFSQSNTMLDRDARLSHDRF